MKWPAYGINLSFWKVEYFVQSLHSEHESCCNEVERTLGLGTCGPGFLPAPAVTCREPWPSSSLSGSPAFGNMMLGDMELDLVDAQRIWAPYREDELLWGVGVALTNTGWQMGNKYEVPKLPSSCWEKGLRLVARDLSPWLTATGRALRAARVPCLDGVWAHWCHHWQGKGSH